MSLFQEIANIGLAFCAYNQALINIEKLDNAQKMQLVKYLLADIHASANDKLEGDL
jgi:hypothetical protein